MLVPQWCFTICEWCALPVTLQVQKRIQKELDEQVGHERPVSMSDRSRLPYLDCVINEGMRIRPVSPVLIPHTARTNSRFSYLFSQKVIKDRSIKCILQIFQADIWSASTLLFPLSVLNSFVLWSKLAGFYLNSPFQNAFWVS